MYIYTYTRTRAHWHVCCNSRSSRESAALLSSLPVHVCCSVLRCVAVCCSVLQCVAVCSNRHVRCNAVQFVALFCSVLQFSVVFCGECGAAVFCRVFVFVGVCCSVRSVPVILFKSRLATPFTMQHDFEIDFWQSLTDAGAARTWLIQFLESQITAKFTTYNIN